MENNYAIKEELIAETDLHYADKFLKTVIKNAVRDYFRSQNKHKQYGFSIVSREACEPLLYEEPGFEMLEKVTYKIDEIQIEVSPEMNSALEHLSRLQQIVLIENVHLKTPHKKIAKRFGFSERMSKKHKANAIQKLQRRLRNEK